MKRHILTVTALVLVLASLLAGPAAARSTLGQDEYRNTGWYTGLEHRDLPSQPALQNQYRNNGWYTGLEHDDLPPVQSSSRDGYLPVLDDTAVGITALAAAMLLATGAVAGRARHRRVAA